MRHGFLMIAGVVLLAGCSAGVPDFLGREGGGAQTGMFSAAGDKTPLPDPVPLPMRTAVAERALNGVILRATGVSATQGYYGAQLVPVNNGAPDAAGIVTLELMAFPPTESQAIGPERTRTLSAAAFYSNQALRKIKAFRVKGGTNVLTLPAPKPPAAPPILATDIPTL